MENKHIYMVPESDKERAALRKKIETFAGSQKLVPPLSMSNLSDLSEKLIADNRLDAGVKGWIMVELNNRVWRDTVASIPYDKRILLLPKCLSNSAKCKADIDDLGLLCHRCNHCTIPDLQDKADSLGVMSIVAEGFTSVVGLIENRVVDTVIGVSCLESLEKAFPLLINNAVPGLAIPLNMAGCKDTNVDYDYVIDMVAMLGDKEHFFIDYDHLKSTLKKWFSIDNLNKTLSLTNDQTSTVAKEWLGGEGKRWRPYLLAATYQAISGIQEMPKQVQLASIAVECFHKASLVHDDIQDNDLVRYGKKTVNAACGIPVAINVGDILLGEGYRLLTECNHMQLIKAASEAHINLCKGQGMELEWSRSPHPLTMDFVLDIFCHKTVPAFDVSLTIGAICAGGDQSIHNILHNYSHALGIAYQLQDDLEDFETDNPVLLRPSAVLAAICEAYEGSDMVADILSAGNIKELLHKSENSNILDNALERVRQMTKYYHQAALDSLNELDNIELKRLLFRVTKRILKNVN